MQRPVQIEIPLKALSVCFISGSFLFLPGCATNSGPSQEVANLRQQIINLQKIQGVQNSQIEELNNKILVLKDQVGGPHAESESSPDKGLAQTQVNQNKPSTAGHAPIPPGDDDNLNAEAGGAPVAGGAVAIRAMHEARPVQEILLDALGDYLKK